MAEESEFNGSDGTALYRRSWPVADARGHIILFHGYGEHSARYDHVAAHFNSLGIAVWGYDHRYHGNSPGKRGTIASFDNLVKDAKAFVDLLDTELGDAPRIFMGHSMGGLVLAHLLTSTNCTACGAVFSSPFLDLKDVNPILLALAGILSKICPGLPVEDLPASSVSRIPEVVAAYDSDPLNNHSKITARTGAELANAVNTIRPKLCDITLPVYIIHGDADALVPCSASTFLHEQSTARDKTLTLYPGAYHELMNDLDQDAVLEAMGIWVQSHLN